MARAAVGVTVDDRDVQQGFDRMMSASQQVRKFYYAMKPPVKKDIREHGKEERGPDGPWVPRATATMARKTLTGSRGQQLKRRRKAAPRQILGKLTKSIRQSVTGAALIIESPIPWAGIHQSGGLAGRGSRIPERPFLYLSDDLIDVAAQAYAAFVKSPFPKGARAKINVGSF